jgi:hypothetical protein
MDRLHSRESGVERNAGFQVGDLERHVGESDVGHGT